MKKLLMVILLLVVLVAAVMGCGGAHRYDSRLTAADSLMQPNPDSALVIVKAICPDSLPDEGDRAYRDLLLTQARYRCYITATSDSGINRALNYYRAHSGEREKLTRAYIYKGAVMDELGHPDSAMLYYKHAEATAAPDDYFNLGYAKMRMGALYRDNYSMDGKHIEKYEEALECFKHTDNKQYELVCMVNLGSLYCLKLPNKADSLLNQALSLAMQIEDTINYVCATQNLIKNDINRDRFSHARGLVQKVTKIDTSIKSIPFCLYAAYVYARLQMPDSAEIFMNHVIGHPITNAMDRISYLEACSEIARSRGDSAHYLLFKKECKHLSDSLQSAMAPLTITSIEEQMNVLSNRAAKESQRISANRVRTMSFLFIFMSVIGIVLYFKRKNNHEKQILQMQRLLDDSESQLANMKQSMNNLKMLNVKDSRLKDFIDSYMSLMRDFMEECYHQPNHKNTQRIKEVIKFQKDNRDKWEKLYGYIDLEFNDIITKTKSSFPHLNDKDLMLIALTTLNFSYIQTALVLGYANATTIGGNKQRLAKKMGLDCSLNEYINRFKIG